MKSELTEKQKFVFTNIMYGFSISDIAKMMNVSYGAVRMKVRKILAIKRCQSVNELIFNETKRIMQMQKDLFRVLSEYMATYGISKSCGEMLKKYCDEEALKELGVSDK